jgi:DNA damage-binding protein 1
MIYSLETSDHHSTTAFSLCKVTDWTQSYIVKCLASHEDKLFMGDAICSVSGLKLENNKLSLVARDYGSLWPVCIQALNNSGIIGANVRCIRLFTSLSG